MKQLRLPAFLLFSALTILSAQSSDYLEEKEENPWTFSFYFENDLFANTDAYYTNGTKFTWVSSDLSKYREAGKLPEWAYKAIRHLPFIQREGLQRNVAFSIGQNIYTPTDTQATNLIIDDRPYVGWLYFGIALHNKTENWLDTIEINFGVVGPWALGENTQNFVHRARDIPTAKGWENQIKNEPALNLIWERKYRYGVFGESGGIGLDLLGHYGASLGNVYTYANMGGGFRFGWNLPKDYGAALIRLAGDTNAPASTKDLRLQKKGFFSLHFFSAIEGRAIARDLTLDGNTWKDSHSIEKENFVGDLAAGIACIVGPWKISYAQVRRTKSFKSGRDHSFGSINISVTY